MNDIERKLSRLRKLRQPASGKEPSGRSRRAIIVLSTVALAIIGVLMCLAVVNTVWEGVALDMPVSDDPEPKPGRQERPPLTVDSQRQFRVACAGAR